MKQTILDLECREGTEPVECRVLKIPCGFLVDHPMMPCESMNEITTWLTDSGVVRQDDRDLRSIAQCGKPVYAVFMIATDENPLIAVWTK